MRRDLIDRLSDLGVESRPIVAGNFLRNPVITKLPHSVVGKLNVADDVHENGFYLGNHHLDIQSELRSLSKLMGELEKEYLE
jgi:CDP-6-deoxy-D-xylo-4-hexulose-3-dehydrase